MPTWWPWNCKPREKEISHEYKQEQKQRNPCTSMSTAAAFRITQTENNINIKGKLDTQIVMFLYNGLSPMMQNNEVILCTTAWINNTDIPLKKS